MNSIFFNSSATARVKRASRGMFWREIGSTSSFVKWTKQPRIVHGNCWNHLAKRPSHQCSGWELLFANQSANTWNTRYTITKTHNRTSILYIKYKYSIRPVKWMMCWLKVSEVSVKFNGNYCDHCTYILFFVWKLKSFVASLCASKSRLCLDPHQKVPLSIY